jgi:hypothetical protein
MSETHYAGKNPWARCPCGHLLLHHDFNEHPDDGTLLCCLDRCDQVGCPGQATQVGGGE